ncbi:MAG: NUDIX hydrolase [Desulfarculaceae bacterium]|nr:NUDIX hydrolase [Desulfarculaceae bacterium]
MSQNPRNPYPTVDIIIELSRPGRPVVLVRRANPPHGWALPGGFVDYGESLEQAARREAAEETGLTVELVAMLGAYSDPARDPRQHNLSVVFIARAEGEPKGGDDAAEARAFALDRLPKPLCFDHGLILDHYRRWRAGERPGAPVQEGSE